MAQKAIIDGKEKSKLFNDMKKAQTMLGSSKSIFLNIVFGNFKYAREQEKQLAKIAVKDFDIYK